MPDAATTVETASPARTLTGWWGRTVGAMSARQVDALLAAATLGAVATGLVSWTIGTGWGRWWTIAHAVCGAAVVVLAPAKARRSARTGMRRRRRSRWLSLVLAVVLLVTVGLGVVHSTGLWTGVGTWSPLWTHVALAFASIPLLVWHMWSRPARPRVVDLDRRALIGGGVAAATAGVAVAAVEGLVHVAGLPGADRRGSGSHEVASFDPEAMPAVSWIDDRAPSTPTDDWQLRIDGRSVPVAELRRRSRPLVAALDCTGGWWSEQRWDVVPLSELLEADAASFEVVSATGYARRFPMRDARVVHLAVGYDGRPLRRGHGAPVRLVAPGRRGPWWVKWVVAVDPTDRPWWLQLPFPPT